MGQVSDQLGDMATKQNATLVGIGLLLVAVVASGGAFNSLMPGDSGDNGDAPTDVGEFAQIDYDVYSTPLTLIDSDQADSVYLVSADAELPDNYGDHTVTASDITSELDEENYHEVTNTNTDGEFEVQESNIGENDFVNAGANYSVMAFGSNSLTHFGEIQVPETIEKFAYTESKAQTVSLDITATDTFSVATQQVEYDGDRQTSGNLNADEALDASDIQNDGKFTAYAEVEADNDGAAYFGDVQVSEVTADAVTNMELEIVADGEVVYSEEVSGDNLADLNKDFVEEKMNENPVEADQFEVTATVEYDTSVVDATNNTQEGIVDITVNDLDGNQVASTLNILG